MTEWWIYDQVTKTWKKWDAPISYQTVLGEPDRLKKADKILIGLFTVSLIIQIVRWIYG